MRTAIVFAGIFIALALDPPVIKESLFGISILGIMMLLMDMYELLWKEYKK